MRQLLEQKHHGVPARGIQGKDGITGAKGISVYIGFINDFFDYTEYDIDPAVRYTKRNTDILNNTTAWLNYKSKYETVSNDGVYYTGEFTPIKTTTVTDTDDTLLFDVVSYNLKLPGETLIENGLYTPDNKETPEIPAGIEHYEFQFIQNISYTTATNKQLSYNEVYDFVDPEDNIDSAILSSYDPVPAYTVHIDVNHITYDYSDLKRIALMKFKALGEKYPYDMWDFFTTHDETGKQIEGKQSEETYKTWLDDPDMFPLFIREKLEGQYKEYRTGVTSYYGVPYTSYDNYNNPYNDYKTLPDEDLTDGRHYLIMPDNDIPAIEDLTYALTYFKQPVKTFPLYAYGTDESEKDLDIMVDYEGYIYIGIDDNTLYKITDDGKIIFLNPNDILTNIRKTDDDKALIDQTNFTLSDQAPFINTLRDYTITLSNNSSKDLLPKNDLVVWHTGTGKLKLPTTLASSINVGDIIYFYTNKGQFNSVTNIETQSQIEYMAIITEDLIGCTLQELIDGAQVIKPFNYSAFNNVYTSERAEINRSAIITNMYRNIPSDIEYDLQGYEHFNIKSIEELLTLGDAGCALRIISGNYINNMQSASLLNFIAKNNSTFDNKKLYSNFKLYSECSNSNYLNKIKIDTGSLAIHNLAVNKDNIKANFELTDIVYDKNIHFTNGYFIYDEINSGNIDYGIGTNNYNTYDYKFTYTITKESIMSNMDNAEDYEIGYILIDDCTKAIRTKACTNESTLLFELIITDNDTLPDVVFKEITEIDGNSVELLYKSFSLIITIRKKNGMLYYSNSTLIITYFDTKLCLDNQTVNIIAYDVTAQYPYIDEKDNGITTNENNINFDIPELTPEDYTGKVHQPINFNITGFSDNINIQNITFNGQPITKKTISNSWAVITLNADNSFTLKLNDNIPDISDSNDDILATNTLSINDYLKTYANTLNTSPLFSFLLKKVEQPHTNERNIKVCVSYTKNDDTDNKVYKEYYNIVLPGFKDPRVLPDFEISLINDFNKLDTINTLENGVLCNQFRTYLDIKMTDNVVDSWLKYNNNVTADITLQLINKDYSTSEDDNPTLILENATVNTPNYFKFTIKPVNSEYNEYFEFNESIDKVYRKQINLLNNTSRTIDGKNIINYNNQLKHILIVQSSIKQVLYTNNYSHYTIIDENINGKILYYNNTIQLTDIPLQYLKDGIRIQIDFEFANPIIALLFLQFAITNVTLHYKDDNDYKFVLNNKSFYQEKIGNEFTKYKFNSGHLKLDINPLSLIADPNSNNIASYQLNTTIVKLNSNINYQINSVLKLYNSAIYQNLLNTEFKKPCKFIYNDNVLDIIVSALKPSDTIQYIKDEVYSNILDIDGFTTELHLNDLQSKNYLSLFYDADIFHPRFRNDVETFYFNDNELQADLYRQRTFKNNEILLKPILFNVESKLRVRSVEEMEAIDIWNYEYLVKYESDLLLQETNHIMIGKNTAYGQGAYLYYNQYKKAIINNPYDSDNILSLHELGELLEQSISVSSNTEDLMHSMSKPSLFPKTGNLFRVLAREMKWEYVYEAYGDIKHALMVTPFDCLYAYLTWTKNNPITEPSYSYHYNNLKLLSDGDNDIAEHYIPYNICYNIINRMGYDLKEDRIHYHMLRKPCITIDKNDLSKNEDTFIPGYSLLSYLNLTNTKLSDTSGDYKPDNYA